MGVFTEQVQGLVSEERTKRQERQRKEQEKQRKEDLKKQLYFILSSYFTEADEMEYRNIYLNLLKNNTKWEIINEITTKEAEEYYLDINYTTILNKIKSSYIIQYNELLKQTKNTNDLMWEYKAKSILNNTTHLTPKKQKKDKLKILFLVLLPILSIYYFFTGALYPKRKKRR